MSVERDEHVNSRDCLVSGRDQEASSRADGEGRTENHSQSLVFACGGKKCNEKKTGTGWHLIYLHSRAARPEHQAQIRGHVRADTWCETVRGGTAMLA